MELGRPERAHGLVVCRRDVADVGHEPVVRVQGVEASHHAVADDLRDDRRGGDGGTASISVDDGAVRRRTRPEPEAVDEARIGGRVQIGENSAQACKIRAVETVPVDRANGHYPDADRGRACTDRFEEQLALPDGDLLRVVEGGQRPHARPAQHLVVEQDTGDDERPGERSAPCLVGARDEANTQLAIESEETLAARSRHAAESTT